MFSSPRNVFKSLFSIFQPSVNHASPPVVTRTFNIQPTNILSTKGAAPPTISMLFKHICRQQTNRPGR